MTAKNNEPAPSFEESLEKLESIVDEMEGGELSLERLIARYEEGSKLLVQCEKKLKEAERKIEIARKKNAANPELEDFDPDA